MKLVITGALGHIGSRLIRELPIAFKGMEIVMIDNMLTQRYCSLFDLPGEGKYRFLEEDILTADLDPLFSGSDAVIHLAAITNAAASFEIKADVENVNFVGTQKVAEACSRLGIPMIFLSTTSVYGTSEETVDENCEEKHLQPQSPYAESKLRAERFLQKLGEEKGLNFIIGRFGTIFGTSIGMRFHTAINKFCWQAVMRQPVTVWRSAMNQKRPYLELGDAMAAIQFILERKLFDRRVYNVLTLNLTVRDILAIISKYIPDLTIQYVDTPIMNQLTYTVENRRFRDLGFTFHGELEHGIATTIRLLEMACPGGTPLLK